MDWKMLLFPLLFVVFGYWVNRQQVKDLDPACNSCSQQQDCDQR